MQELLLFRKLEQGHRIPWKDTSFSDWEAVGADGVIQSPNLRYIQIQMTLSTTDTSMTPELSAIQIYETPKAPYSKLGYARPVVLSDGGIREAVLENAYDIIVTSELNGSDYLEFSIPFKDGKRSYLDNEKKRRLLRTFTVSEQSRMIKVRTERR